MKLQCTRTDLTSPADMAMFQRAFTIYMATNGYKEFEYTLTVDQNGLTSCNITPDLDDTQKNDVLARMQALKSVMVNSTDAGVQYVFA